MPQGFQNESNQARLARLAGKGRRCDGRARNCTQSAVYEFTLLPADGHGNANPDAEQVTKRSCTDHRKLYELSGMWVVVTKRELDNRGSNETPDVPLLIKRRRRRSAERRGEQGQQ